MFQMVFGRGTVEIVERDCRVKGLGGERIEACGTVPGLSWYRFEVDSLMPDHGGYVYHVMGHGGDGWAPACNVRNFRPTGR